MTGAIWRGRLRRSLDQPDTMVGYLEDEWGWRVELVGTVKEGRWCELVGTVCDPPPGLRVPAIDDPGEN